MAPAALARAPVAKAFRLHERFLWGLAYLPDDRQRRARMSPCAPGWSASRSTPRNKHPTAAQAEALRGAVAVASLSGSERARAYVTPRPLPVDVRHELRESASFRVPAGARGADATEARGPASARRARLLGARDRRRAVADGGQRQHDAPPGAPRDERERLRPHAATAGRGADKRDAGPSRALLTSIRATSSSGVCDGMRDSRSRCRPGRGPG